MWPAFLSLYPALNKRLIDESTTKLKLRSVSFLSLPLGSLLEHPITSLGWYVFRPLPFCKLLFVLINTAIIFSIVYTIGYIFVDSNKTYDAWKQCSFDMVAMVSGSDLSSSIQSL
jgi:hypothetical protein